ncbi:MAG: PspC domain-containing protein [Bacteroidales bacterium]|nr:PspC domain-containing protein [Bacteroidales bacterium]
MTEELRRLYRSRRDRIIGGVCGGLGEYFKVDPVLLRVLWAVMFFAGGMGLLAYIIAWIIVPEEPVGSGQ